METLTRDDILKSFDRTSTEQFKRDVARRNNELIEKVLRTMVVPPLEGEITSEVIAKSGVMCVGRFDGEKTEWWIEQHGTRISGISTIELVR